MTGLVVIEGAEVVPLQRFEDERGSVMHMLKSTDSHFRGFGEIYFSSVYPGVVKAWKLHRRMTANYACVLGRILVVLHDDREGSSTRGATLETTIGPDEHHLVVIPPGVWHGFKGLGQPASILANCATEPADPDELDRLDPTTNLIPYAW